MQKNYWFRYFAGMLEVGVKKLQKKKPSNTIEMILGDSENMPLRTTLTQLLLLWCP
jgi:ubiquinone/menaquinone biosynthesis C-methylase UbiE